MNFTELLQKIMLLTSNVDSLKTDVKRLVDKVSELNDRVVRVENNGELVAEKAKNAALTAAQVMNAEILRELYSLKARIDGPGKASPIAVPLPVDHSRIARLSADAE